MPCPSRKAFISVARHARHVRLRCGSFGWNPARERRPSCRYSFAATAACVSSSGRRFPREPRPRFVLPGGRPSRGRRSARFGAAASGTSTARHGHEHGFRIGAKSSAGQTRATRYLLCDRPGTQSGAAVFVFRADTGGRAMAMVMISCPNTGRDVPTGIETDPSMVEDQCVAGRVALVPAGNAFPAENVPRDRLRASSPPRRSSRAR